MYPALRNGFEKGKTLYFQSEKSFGHIIRTSSELTKVFEIMVRREPFEKSSGVSRPEVADFSTRFWK